jgi:hypothetical protein
MKTLNTNLNLSSRQSSGRPRRQTYAAAAQVTPGIDQGNSQPKDGSSMNQSDADTTAVELTIPDPDEIRPRRPIPQAEITEVENWHRELHDLRRWALNRAFDIGFKLRCWHDLIPHGKWLPWLKANVAIPERTASQYLLLWDHNEEIKAAFKSADPANLNELPPIKDALALIANKRAGEHPRPNTTHQVVHRIPAIKTPAAPRPVDSADDQATDHLKKIETDPNDQTDPGPQLNNGTQGKGKTRLTNKPNKEVPQHEYCEVGWVLFTTERDMAVLALTPSNEKWKKSALGFFESLRNRKIETVS